MTGCITTDERLSLDGQMPWELTFAYLKEKTSFDVGYIRASVHLSLTVRHFPKIAENSGFLVQTYS